MVTRMIEIITNYGILLILLLSKFFLIVAQELKRELMHASVRVERLKVGLSSVLNNDDLK